MIPASSLGEGREEFSTPVDFTQLFPEYGAMENFSALREEAPTLTG
jgi:hypothetical protein